MTEQAWYSASLILAVINEHGGLWRRVTSVVLLRATDFADAFQVACDLGHGMEEIYVNSDAERVRWAFERVATLDLLSENLTSGMEVYSEPHDVAEPAELTFNVSFSPEQHTPGQSGVSPT